MKQKYNYQINDVQFALAERIDLGQIQKLGLVFCAFDQNDSGNISFGIMKNNKKYFVKIAGWNTVEAKIGKDEAINNLHRAYHIYEEIHHPNLIKPIKFWDDGNCTYLLFPYVEGSCLYDHWNFDEYERNNMLSPLERFLKMDVRKKINVTELIFSFMRAVKEAGYLATDFYEGSILYNFKNDTTHFCDIDFFTKIPCVNMSGKQWGSVRFLAPEEKKDGMMLTARTDVYHMGIFLQIFFGREEEHWQLSSEKFRVMKKAVEMNPEKRYQSINELYEDWSRSNGIR